MKKTILFLIIIVVSANLFAQTKSTSSCSQVIIPSPQRQRPVKGVKAEVSFPEKFEAFICFEPRKSNYTEDALNALDSVYKVAFDKDNGKFYKITIIGYDDAEQVNEKYSSLARERAIKVFDYFASREETEFIVRKTPSKFYHSCNGTTECIIKYKMPFDFKWINLSDKPIEERSINKIDLKSKVYILVENNPDECLGKFNDYYYPSQDTTILTQNMSMLKMPKGALESITHTKDTLNSEMTLQFEDVLSFEDLTRNYQLIPHRRQYIINAGYFVLKSNHQPNYETCELKENFKQDITIRLPLEMQQNEAKLKFFAKTYKPDGTWEYKAIPTAKDKDKETKLQAITGSLSAFQLDTIYVGKKIDEKEMSDYFYPAKEGEPGAFQAMGGWLKPYKLDKRGSIVLKKSMEMILRKPIGESIGE